jgi:hypothetical protein
MVVVSPMNKGPQPPTQTKQFRPAFWHYAGRVLEFVTFFSVFLLCLGYPADIVPLAHFFYSYFWKGEVISVCVPEAFNCTDLCRVCN